MPKTTSIPRISIVVPVGSDTAAFEDTLASVLRNRPAASEILVAHNGQYHDPFNLSDEVSFVTTDSSSVVDLIMAGAECARAQFVHVLTPGFQAIEDWTVKALEGFDQHDIAVVTPVIRDASNHQIVAAGWNDTSFRLCQPVGVGAKRISRQAVDQVSGAYLQASFWRRSVLQSLATAFTGGSITESSYAFGQLIMQAGWRSVLAPQCQVSTQLAVNDWDKSSFNRGRQLRAIRTAIARSDVSMPLLANLLGSITSPGSIGETLGQANYRGRLAAVKRHLRVAEVATCRDSDVLSMHSHAKMKATTPLRRAA